VRIGRLWQADRLGCLRKAGSWRLGQRLWKTDLWVGDVRLGSLRKAHVRLNLRRDDLRQGLRRGDMWQRGDLQQRLRLRKADLRQRRDLRRRGDLRRRDNVRHGVRRDLRETHVRIVVRRAGLRDAALAAIG